MSKQFYFKQLILAKVRSLNVKNIQFSSIWHKIEPYQVLPLRTRGDTGEMAMKMYSAFHKASALLEPHNQII